jgi:hypothetical protein
MAQALTEYLRILDLNRNCTIDDIKKAYRKKAREFHPDINNAPEAKDMFICVTEAYEFLITYFERMSANEESYRRAMDDWKKYRQMRSRQKARVYAQTSYVRFKNTNFYKTTRIFDGTTIISSVVISVMVLVVTIYGYIFRVHHPIPGEKNPSVWVLMGFILLGMILFTVSIVFLKAYIQSSKKRRRSL